MFHQLKGQVKQGLWIELLREEIQRQNGFNKDTKKPKSCLFLKDNLQYLGQYVRMALRIDEGAISL